MNPEINIEVTATVRWNALENTIISYMIHGDRSSYPSEKDYTYKEMVELNGQIGNIMDPEMDTDVPERLKRKDPFTDKNEVKELFDKTETLISNIERAILLADTFSYDPKAEL